MCVSNNEIERQAYIMSEKIRENSVYKLVLIKFIDNKNIDLQNHSIEQILAKEDLPLISKVTLEDEEGMRFDIEPNEIGLSYAKGEITYKEYKQMQSKENKLFIGYLTLLSSGFLLISWGALKLFFM
ncbi:hypothetical protein [Planomicrobium sp. MB-3u-38]|uniref:hypothetical protein n=1 Tax=Planomicrobium sp. MB-3u-38 TaxID=2058318 RepID=UPI000C7D3C81|nr:hypothetical protein [Planomicrobium sp. MB-3u-38]PKH10320.1 hypothetical protein CXF70_10335 [Planomicrobium sp. MB-3u-38]